MAIIHGITDLSNSALTRELDLINFLESEYKYRKKPSMVTLRRLAARGKIPGARKDGKNWVVNMEIYQNFKCRQIERSLLLQTTTNETTTKPLSTAQRVAQALKEKNK